MKRALCLTLLGLFVGCDAVVPAQPPCSTTVCAAGQVCNPSTGVCEVPPSRCQNVSCTSPMSCDGTTGLCVFPTGDLIDRAGRPLINIALSNPFDLLTVSGQLETGNTTRERYNHDKAFPWSSWAVPFAQTLAIYDGLDGTCGHPFAPSTLTTTRYATLASLLAADAIVVDTSKASCNSFLAVERSTLAGTNGTDCGGRKPDYDVVDLTFSTLFGGLATDNVVISNAPSAVFPYLP